MTTLKDIFKDALPIIEKASPVLAGLLGGPAGLVLGNVVPLLATAFDTPSHNLTDLVANIAKDPHADAKIKSVEAIHGDWLTSLLGNKSGLTEAEINIKLKWDCDKNNSNVN